MAIMLSGKRARCASISGARDQDENPDVGSMSPHLYEKRKGGPAARRIRTPPAPRRTPRQCNRTFPGRSRRDTGRWVSADLLLRFRRRGIGICWRRGFRVQRIGAFRGLGWH
jgi:nitroreductase